MVQGFAAVPTVIITGEGKALPGVVIGIGQIPGIIIPPTDVWPQHSGSVWPQSDNAGWGASQGSAWTAADGDEWPQTDDEEWLVRT